MLDRLHISGELTRSKLAAQTGLNRSTIRDLVGELTGLGLAVEDRGTSAGPGRPSSVARARPTGAVVLAVELEVDSTAVATVGLGGHIFDRVRVPNAAGPQSPGATVEHLAALSSPLIAALPRGHRMAGVGVAVAGVVRRHDGFVHVAPNLGWSNVPLAGMIAAGLGIDRVMMANEGDLGALAEHRRGNPGRHRNLIFIAGEVGVGIGVIYDGKPMLGTSGYAGEAGHMMVNPDGRRCRCGASGCWETEVGEEALARLIGFSGDRENLIEEVLRRAHAGDQATFLALGELGRWLGLGIGNLINLFNPDQVVIGGFFHAIYPFLEHAVLEGAQEMALTAPWLSSSIRRSQLGIDSALIGASELVFAEVISDPSGFAGPNELDRGMLTTEEWGAGPIVPS